MSTSYLDKNVHRRLELESDILNPLCASYRALYRVNLDTDTAEPYAISAKMRPEVALLMEPRLPYSLAIERYITHFVLPTDQNRLRVQTSAVAILAFVLAVTNILCPFMVKFILTRHPADEQSRQNTHKLADAKQ